MIKPKKTYHMKQILIFLFAFFLASHVFSQKKAIDLSVVPLTPDFTILGDSVYLNDSTKMLVQFKINYPDSIQNIQIKFGTVQGGSDVLLLNPAIIYSDSKYYTLLNGNQNEITNFDAKVYYTLTDLQFRNYNYLTLIVSYIDGASDTLSWLKQNPNN